MEDKFLIGKIVKPQGIKGELKIDVQGDAQVFDCADYIFVSGMDDKLKIKEKRYLNNFAYVKVETINSIEQAERLRNKEVYISRTDAESFLKNDEFFIEDILNFNMVFEDGEELGILTDVQNYGSSDVYFVQCKNKNISKLKEISFANKKGVVEEIDLKNAKIILNKKLFLEVVVSDED